MARERKLKDKVCSRCSITYSPQGTAQKYCVACIPIILKENSDRHRRKKGIPVGVGSGGNQGKGKTHHTYKTGIGGFREKAKSEKAPICERCNKNLDFSKRYTWCVHHRDHTRKNNELENLELLCKRCHQLEHDCTSHLPQFLVKV